MYLGRSAESQSEEDADAKHFVFLVKNLLVAIAKAVWLTFPSFPLIYTPNDRSSFTRYIFFILFNVILPLISLYICGFIIAFKHAHCGVPFHQKILKDINWCTIVYKIYQKGIIYSSNKIGAADHDAVSTSVAIFKIHLNLIF